MSKLSHAFVVGIGLLWGCTAEETIIEPTDFAFDGTCVNCHTGLTAGHVHTNYKLRCIDCHGGDDTVNVPANAATNKNLDSGGGGYRDNDLIKAAHVNPDPKLARFFYANGIDDDGDGFIDEATDFNNAGQTVTDLGEIFEPGLHGEGGGEFMDAELNRDLNYTRFLNPGDLRIATVGCGSGNKQAGTQGFGCHQETIDIVRRSIMVEMAAVTNGAYYGNESFDAKFQAQRDGASNGNQKAKDPRFGAFGYGLDYDSGKLVGQHPSAQDLQGICIKAPVKGTAEHGKDSQPTFDRACLQARASGEDDAVKAGAPGNVGLPAFEIAQGTIKNPLFGQKITQRTSGAGDSRWEGWGGQPIQSDAHAELAPLRNQDLLPPGLLPVALDPLQTGVPDPVDNILRTFRAYYPANYPASTTNFNFTFGTSIDPNFKRFRTATPYGRGHSSGCAGCHTPYNYEGNREPQRIRNDDGTFTDVIDPTTRHREFNPDNDQGPVGIDQNGDDIPDITQERLIGRPVGRNEVFFSGGVSKEPFDLDGNGTKDGEQQKTYSAKHNLTTKIDTDTCGLCHGFVTRINYAYQGAAEEEQRDVLSRRKPIEFKTPQGTDVIILDDWIREELRDDNNNVIDPPKIVVPAGVAIVQLARKRDADLKRGIGPDGKQISGAGCDTNGDGKDDFEFPRCGMIAGAGGCAQNTFSEDCNNNGELDHNLVLERRDIDGNLIATVTIDEDLNHNGKLDLVDRIPREKAIDGRQVRYVYGGRNNSTKQSDVHFDLGMHCIDCHFMQDVHGDGNVYSTNWDAIEIECEDCHGASQKTNFKTSGPNGGNDMRIAKNEDLEPFFEDRDGQVIQRSRVNTGLFWVVPQTKDAAVGNTYAKQAHDPDYHVAEPGAGSEFAGEQGQSEITRAKVECATCHNGWIHNCVGCHIEIDIGNKQRNKISDNGGGVLSVSKSAGENEIWLSNTHNNGHINFQLLGLMRGGLQMGVGSSSEKGRLSLFRSSMQVIAGVSDGNGDQLRENLSFTTFQNIDGNSGRMNAATSGVAMNQTMAHTVRPKEARGCEVCHTLVDQQGRARNEHLIAETMGIGTGAMTFTGDWLLAAGANGIEMFEYKQDKENPFGLNQTGQSERFPGLIINPGAAPALAGERKPAAVEPVFAGATTANDVILMRNFNPTPAVVGTTAGPTLRDFAVAAVNNAGAGQLVITDVSLRGHPAQIAGGRPNAVANGASTQIVALTGIPTAVANMASDLSDPFVYATVGASGIDAVELTTANPIGGAPVFPGLTKVNTAVPGEITTDLALAGDFVYVGTQSGKIITFQINKDNPAQLTQKGQANVGAAVNRVQVMGFVLYIATPSGLAILTLDDPFAPARPAGAPNFVANTANANGVAIAEGHAYVATNQGLVDVDARTVADPQPGVLLNAAASNAMADVIVSEMPGQRWVIGLEAAGANVVGVKLDNRQSRQERCFTNQGLNPDCLLDMQMYDAQRNGRDPSFNPVTGAFDAAAVDPSGPPTFTMQKAIIGLGKRFARPVLWEAIGTLSGRRYRDSFMPGSGALSFTVMETMRNVQVCETDQASTNPAGLNLLGIVEGSNCVAFPETPIAKPACRPGKLGPGLKPVTCPKDDVKTAKPSQPIRPTTPPKPPAPNATVTRSRSAMLTR